MRNYSAEIRRCEDVARMAESGGDERLAGAARRLAKSFKRWESDAFSGGSAMSSMEGRRDSDVHHIDRLVTLCKVTLQRMAESMDSGETDGLRGDLARYRHELAEYELDSDGVSKQLREMKSSQ